MDLSTLDAIDDPKALREAARELVSAAMATVARQAQALEARDQLIQAREHTISHRDAHIAALTAEIARLRRLQFSARSERMDPAQRELFEETMAADIAAVEAQLQAIQSEGEAPAATQKRRKASVGRQPLPAHLERVETRHEPASCTCPQCQGELTPEVPHFAR